MKYYILLFSVVTLCGCAVTYLEHEKESLSYSTHSGCPSSFYFSGSSDYKEKDIKEGSHFWRRPHTEDYVEWIKETLVEQGCNTELSSDPAADFAVHVHEHYMSSDRHQGTAILGWLTLFVVPIPNETYYRDVSFRYKEQKSTHSLKEKSWLGWYFIPVHLYSYAPHDKYFISQKLEELFGQK